MINNIFNFKVPDSKKIRVIINTDAKNEADDQFAIIHALLTPKFIISGIIAAHFGSEKSTTSMQDSYNEVLKLLNLMEIQSNDLLFHGAEKKLNNINEKLESNGSDFIISEAMKEDKKPLFCIFLGPLTDMAIALMKEPQISSRLTVIWIGGGDWDLGGWEYNLSNDILAANIVFSSDVNLWQVPRNIYSRIRVSLSELQLRVQPKGEIGEYLFKQMIEVNDKYAENKSWPIGESWALGDSAAIGLLMDDQEFYYTYKTAPQFNDKMEYVHNQDLRKIRVYHDIDVRFILEDFYSKIEIYNQYKKKRQ